MGILSRRWISLPTILVVAISGIAIGILALINAGDSDPGQALYERHCQSCHLEKGQGLGQLIPPLAGSDWLVNHQDKIACILRYGQHDSIVVNGVAYFEKMPGNPDLTDGQIFTLIKFINTSWGNDIPTPTFKQVKQQLKGCSDRTFIAI